MNRIEERSLMSHETITEQAHIAYDLIDDVHPSVVVIEFLSPELVGPRAAGELGEQLESLLFRPGLPRTFVLDFSNVRVLGSTAFSEIVSFAKLANRPYVCNLRRELRLGADIVGLSRCTEFAASRSLAIDAAQRAATQGEVETADYPCLVS
jgi:anti-anti-sigma regulatory factor